MEKIKQRGEVATRVVAELTRYEAALREATSQTASQLEAMATWLESQDGITVVGGATALTLSAGGSLPQAARRSRPAGAGDGTPTGTLSQVSVEDVVVPATALQAQLFDCVADDSSIDDLYFQLDATLKAGALDPGECWCGSGVHHLSRSHCVAGHIDVETVLKEVRELGRKQFRARALAKAIDGALWAKLRVASGGVAAQAGTSGPAGR